MILPSLQELAGNQFLIGGVGTMLTGALLYVLRAIPQQIWNALRGCTVLNLDVTTRYPEYNEVAALLGHHIIGKLTREYSPNHARGSRYEGDKVGKGLAPGFGRGFAFYRGTLLTFYRKRLESANKIEESIDISFLTRNTAVLTQFLEEAGTFQDRNRLKVKVAGADYIMNTVYKEKRSLESVFIQESVKRQLIDRFTRFVEGEEWYAQRGIPYRFCGLLYGEPGTGKTSLVNAVASHFGLDIVYLTTLTDVDALMNHCSEGDLIVIEDIDALSKGLDRRGRAVDDDGETVSESGASSATLHRLLNVLDGFCTPHALKVMMTTNYPDRLDPALLRPGRTDIMLDIGKLGITEVAAMYRAFYDRPLNLTYLFRDWKGSELQEMFVSHDAVQARNLLGAPAREKAA